MTNINKLIEIMEKLRQPDGCPWDREQNHQSLRRYLIEETYEVVDAIDSQNMNSLKEELGDLLLQIIFHCEVAKETNNFNMQDVIDAISNKLIRRHPHVFENTKINTAKEVEFAWEKIKNRELKSNPDNKKSVVDGVPKTMPSLLQALRLTEKAARVGFDWKNINSVMAKVDEELLELKEAMQEGNVDNIKHEFGDLIFSLCNLARHYNIEPEAIHVDCIERFKLRFKKIEAYAAKQNKELSDYSLEALEAFWQKAKKEL